MYETYIFFSNGVFGKLLLVIADVCDDLLKMANNKLEKINASDIYLEVHDSKTMG